MITGSLILFNNKKYHGRTFSYSILVFGVVTLSGCVSSSGVVPMGEDTYMISRSDNSSPVGITGASVKADVLREANEYCIKQGKKLQPISSRQAERGLAPANAEVQFMCLALGDSDLQRVKHRIGSEDSVRVEKDVTIRDESVLKRDVYGELIKLDDLRKRGLLTDSEFLTEKARLLK